MVSFARLGLGLGVLLVVGSACVASGTPQRAIDNGPPSATVQRDADVPDLPFPDNPDPNACGIPTPFGDHAGWVNGTFHGQVVEPTVFLYDSHERKHITGALPSGTQVQVQEYQANPVLDFYLVRADTADGSQTGWVPAPFLQLTPPDA